MECLACDNRSKFKDQLSVRSSGDKTAEHTQVHCIPNNNLIVLSVLQ